MGTSTQNRERGGALSAFSEQRTPTTVRSCRPRKLGVVGHRPSKNCDHLSNESLRHFHVGPARHRDTSLTRSERYGLKRPWQRTMGDPPRHRVESQLGFGVVEVRTRLPVDDSYAARVREHRIHPPSQYDSVHRLARDVDLCVAEPIHWKRLEPDVELLNLSSYRSEFGRFQRQRCHGTSKVLTSLLPTHRCEILRLNRTIEEMPREYSMSKAAAEHGSRLSRIDALHPRESLLRAPAVGDI